MIKRGMYYNPDTIIFYQDQFLAVKDLSGVDAYSQSLHYGYAVFEGIRSYHIENGAKIFKAKEHYERLQYSAGAIQIPFRYSVEELIRISYELLERNKFTNAYLRPLVFCPPNMGLTKARESYLTIQAWEWTNGYLMNNMRIMTSSFRRPNPSGFIINAKVSGHYVNSILACQEAKDKGYDEALLLDDHGYVAEGPGANVFFEKDGILYTPPAGNILPGITRATVIELCRDLQIPVKEKLFRTEEMKAADAAFFCGTAAEIVELHSLDDVPFKRVWDETVSWIIQKAYRNLVLEKNVEPHYAFE